MLRRWHVLLLILVTLTAFCGLAAAKLRATPKYDRVKTGMSVEEVEAIFGRRSDRMQILGPEEQQLDVWGGKCVCDEGTIFISFEPEAFNESGGALRFRVRRNDSRVVNKSITRRGPQERLAWLAGWR